ncbi:transcriptional regulator [Streptomyces melanogenes]|uniref:transcriptional regulator n=1 Tax=Streptomyces melanogenes TaxID=67326 RepID=UPI0037B5FBAB
MTAAIRQEFAIFRLAMSQHQRILRESGFTTVHAKGTRRLYAVDAAPLRKVDVWLERFCGFWDQRLDALGTELARGRQSRRLQGGTRGG